MDDAYAPDGSPVLLYATLAPTGEPEIVHAAVPAGAEILELGAGAGRLSHPLLALGHGVVAVDQSQAMLDRIQGAETVLADIETLELRRRFPVVLLTSNFVNDPNRGRVHAYLECCARHVARSGQVLLQGYPRDWSPDSSWRELGGVRARLRSCATEGPLVRGEMEYVIEGRSLFHAFEARLLGEHELEEHLEAVGLRLSRFLDERGAWAEAVPIRD